MRRRIARYALNTLAALSLLLLIASVELWVRSYFVAEELWNATEHATQERPWITRIFMYGAAREWGKLDVSWRYEYMPVSVSRSLTNGWQYLSHKPSAMKVGRVGNKINFSLAGSRLIYTVQTTTNGWRFDYFSVDVPFGIFLIFAAPPILWWRRRRKLGGRGFAVASSVDGTCE